MCQITPHGMGPSTSATYTSATYTTTDIATASDTVAAIAQPNQNPNYNDKRIKCYGCSLLLPFPTSIYIY